MGRNVFTNYPTVKTIKRFVKSKNSSKKKPKTKNIYLLLKTKRISSTHNAEEPHVGCAGLLPPTYMQFWQQPANPTQVPSFFLKMKDKISPLWNSKIPRSLSTSIAKGTINSRCYNEKQTHRKYWRRDGTQVLNCTCNSGECMAFIILFFQITL